jgi:hypothetical protein
MTKKQIRQKSALERLELQLKSGVKTIKESQKNVFVEFKGTESLTDKDRNRIQKEIQILKSRV